MKPQIENLGKVSVTVEQKYWAKDAEYDRLTIVEDIDTIASYISRQDVPAGIDINNREYWIPLGRVSDYLEVFVEEERSMLQYLEQSVREALEDNQEFHNTAKEEVETTLNNLTEAITIALNTIDATNTTVTDNESDRRTAENKRVIAENERVTEENERVAAEALRQEAELNREAAETERQRKYTNEYDAYENNRRNAETLRNVAESARQEQEAYRISNEERRNDAEGIRRSAENVRISSETSRQQAEQKRVSNENARVTAETNRELQEGSYGDKPDANGSRWARFYQAQTERDIIAQQEENARNATFNTAESTRQTTFTTNEGKSTDSANASGSRWARFNKTLNDANTTLNNKITEIQNKANQDLGDLAELAETAVTIEEALENKANIDGSYESMNVGSAKNIMSENSISISHFSNHKVNNEAVQLCDQYQIDSGIAKITNLANYGFYYQQLVKTDYEFDYNGVHVSSKDYIITIEGTTIDGSGVQLYPTLFEYSSAFPKFDSERENGFMMIRILPDNPVPANLTTVAFEGYKVYTKLINYITTYLTMPLTANTYINTKLILTLYPTTLNGITSYDTKSMITKLNKKFYDYEYNPGEVVTYDNINITSTNGNVVYNASWQNGYLEDGKTILTDSTRYTVCDFVAVTPGITYLLKYKSAVWLTTRVCYYDKNKNYISYATTLVSSEIGVATNTPYNNGDYAKVGDRIFTTPLDVYYIKISVDGISSNAEKPTYVTNIDNLTVTVNKPNNINTFTLNLNKLSAQLYDKYNYPYLYGKNLSYALSITSNGDGTYTIQKGNHILITSDDIEYEVINSSIGRILKYPIPYQISLDYTSYVQIKWDKNKPADKINICSTISTSAFNLDSELILNKLAENYVMLFNASNSSINYTPELYILLNDNIKLDDIYIWMDYYVNARYTSNPITIDSQLSFPISRYGAIYIDNTPTNKLEIQCPESVVSVIKGLPRDYISTQTFNKFLTAINSLLDKKISLSYNEITKQYTVTLTQK